MDVINQSIDRVDSTNTWVKNHLSSLDKNTIFCLSAEEQTQGKGRKKRTWHSPKGQNIYATFYFTLPLGTCNIQCIGLLLAYSIVKVLQKKNIACKIKWPNDILLHGKKIGGILCETVTQKKHIDVILGFGLNVNMPKEELAHIDQPSSSLLIETNLPLDKQHLLLAIQKEFTKDLDIFKEKGFGYFQASITNFLAYLGEVIICHCNNETHEGVLHSISCDGALNICMKGQEMKAFLNAEIEFKQPV